MTVAVSSIRLPTTIATIVLLSLLCIIPVILYLRIILKFVFDRNLQQELLGKGAKQAESGPGTDQDQTKKVPDPSRVLLSFKDVTYTVRKTQKQILRGVTGYFAPGTLTAILGTSGKLIIVFTLDKAI